MIVPRGNRRRDDRSTLSQTTSQNAIYRVPRDDLDHFPVLSLDDGLFHVISEPVERLY